MARPEPTLNGIIFWLAFRWGNVRSFQALAERGIPSTVAMVRANVEEFLRDAMTGEGIFAGNEARLRKDVDLDALAAQMTQGHFDNARAYLDSAVLIFAHSILDETVIACLRLVKRIVPAEYHAAKKKRPTAKGELPGRMERLLELCGYSGGHT